MKSRIRKNQEHVPGPYETERFDAECGTIVIKYPIHINKSRLALMDQICVTLNQAPQSYLAQALYEKIDSDLNNKTELGRAFCDNLLEDWNINNEENNHNVLKYSMEK